MLVFKTQKQNNNLQHHKLQLSLNLTSTKQSANFLPAYLHITPCTHILLPLARHTHTYALRGINRNDKQHSRGSLSLCLLAVNAHSVGPLCVYKCMYIMQSLKIIYAFCSASLFEFLCIKEQFSSDLPLLYKHHSILLNFVVVILWLNKNPYHNLLNFVLFLIFGNI